MFVFVCVKGLYVCNGFSSVEEGLVEVNLHDEYDGPSWTEGMSVQNQEIKRLEEEVAYLKDQCDRWRRQAEGEEKEDAEKLQVIFPVISEQEEIATLKDEIEVRTYICTYIHIYYTGSIHILCVHAHVCM